MGDPIKELHHKMVQSDLLEGDNQDYAVFASKLADDAGRDRLYEVLKANGKISMPLEQFKSEVFTGWTPPEKKNLIGSDSGEQSLADNQPARTAEPLTDWTEGRTPVGEEPLVDLSLSNAQLAEKLRAQSAARGTFTPPTRDQGVGSTAVNIPLKDIPKRIVTGTENPLEAGDAFFKENDKDYDYKEQKAALSGWRKGARDMRKVEVYADRAKKQSDFAAFEMREKYGAGWLDEMNALSKELESPAPDISPDQMLEKQARFNNMKNDPAFQNWESGVKGQQNSFLTYKEIGRNNPEYTRALAQQEFARAKADDSAAFKAASFLGQITGPVVAGIATLPRTLLSAVGVQNVPVVEQIADWGDKQTEFVETQTSIGSKGDRALWERIAAFDGLDVTVDDNKRPVAAYKNGKKVDMTPEQVAAFEATGAGEKARSTYTGWENAGWATAKQLANLYLMRSLGGGTAVGTGATSFVTSYNDLYREALDQLQFSPQDAAQYAIANAGVQAAAEGYLGKIDVGPLQLAKARAIGMQEAKALAGTTSAKEIGKRAGTAMMREVLGENAEELVQKAGDHLTTAMFNAKTGGDIEREWDAQQVAETILLTTATTLLAGGFDTPRAAKNELRTNALLAATQNPEALQPVLQTMVQDGQIAQEEADVAMKNVAALAQIEQELPQDMAPEDKAYVLALELEKKQIADKAAVAPEIEDTAKAEVKQIDTIIEAVKNPDSVPEGEPSPVQSVDPVSKKEEAPVPEPEPEQAEVVGHKKDLTAILNNDTFASKKEDMSFEEWESTAEPVLEREDSNTKNSVYVLPSGDHITLHQHGRRSRKYFNEVSTGWQLPVGGDYGLAQFGGTLNENDFYTPDGYGMPVFAGADPVRSAFLWTQWARKNIKLPEGNADVPASTEISVAEVPKKTGPPTEMAAEASPSEAYTLVSAEIRRKMDESDVQNLETWVQDNLNDPDEMAKYPSRGEAVLAFVQEYEDYALAPKYGAMQKPSPDDVQAATQVANSLDDAQASQVEQFVDKHTRPDGTIDINAVDTDIANAPEAIKTLLNENTQKQPERADANQRNQKTDKTAVRPQGQVQTEWRDPGDGDGPAPGTQELGQGRPEPIKTRLSKVALPSVDNDVLTELVSDGAIEESVADGARKYLEGNITESTADDYNAALDALGALRKIPARKRLMSSDNLQVFQRESDGAIEISGDYANSLGLKYFGGKWVATSQKWVVPKESETAVLEHISEQMAPVDERFASPSGGAVGEIMKSPGAVVNARRRRTRFKNATSFSERLQIAEAEHGLRGNVADPKKQQRVLRQLAKSMPGVTVETDLGTFNSKIQEIATAKGLDVEIRDGIAGFLVDDRWEAPMAFEADGVVYVNPRLAHVDAIVHEFGHLWNSWLRVNNPEEFARGIESVRGTDYHEAVMSHPLYADLTEEQQLEEALAHAIGDAGQRISDMTPFVRFRAWLSDLWRDVQRAFGIGDAGQYTVEQWANFHARTLLSGSEATRITGRKIVEQDRMNAAKNTAAELERAGEMPEDIYRATGWRRGSDGQWYFKPLSVTPRYDKTAQFEAGQVLDLQDVIAAPALAGVSIKVKIASGIKEPFSDGSHIVMSPVISDAYLQKVVAVAQDMMPKPRLDGRGVQEQPARFIAFRNPKVQQAAQGSTDHAARMQSAKQIIRIELQNDGMKDYETKAKALSDSLGLRLDDVLRIFQEEAQAASMGRFVLALGDAKSLGAGKMGELAEAASIKYDIVAENLSRWFRRWFTVNGLFPGEVKELADQRARNIAMRLRGAQFLLKDLNAAMKRDYGTPTDGHWRLVDNVLRGEAGWGMLPANVRSAAVAIRNFTDSMSQELITSGATNGKMILTILNNSGVSATQEKLQDWNGVNLYDALNKLPYERSQVESDAIKDFLARNQKMLGSYFYRSYRKHKDKDWAKKVPPAVLADARAFLIKEAQAKIAELEDARDAKVDELHEALDSKDLQIDAIIEGINAAIDGAKQELQEATDAVVHSQNPDPALRAAQAEAQAKLDEWMDRQKDATVVTNADLAILESLTEADMGAYAKEVARIVKLRMQKAVIQEKIAAALNFKQDDLDNLTRLLSVPSSKYGRLGGIDGLIYNEILAIEDTESVIASGNLGSKDLSFIRKRKDIAPEIRELMGEYHDARVNFAASTMRMVNVLENQMFLAGLRQNFEGKYFFPPEQRDMGIEMAARGSGSMDPLNGWRATPEVAMAIKDHFNPRPDMGPVIGSLRYLSDMVKYGKTIMSPVTHFRNFFSNLYFAVQNAYSPFKVKDGAIAFSNAWKNLSEDQQRQRVQRLSELGILGEGAWSSDIRSLMERINADSVDQLMVGGRFAEANKWLQRTYQAEDDFWRIVGFETEKGRYSRALYGKAFEALSPDQKDDIERRAADIVAETMPTYSNVPRFAAALREVPLFGTFIAFPAEMFRVSANQLKRALQTDMRDPRTRGVAIQRLAGIALAQALPLAAVSLGRWIAGVSDEEEDSARFFVPEWQEDSMWVWETFDPGVSMSFRNLGYSDPYSFYKRPIVAMSTSNGRDLGAKLGDAAWGLVKPFLDVELTTGTILALAYNKKPNTSEPIYNPGDGILGDWRNSFAFAAKQLQPGVVKFGFDVSEAVTGEGTNGRPPKQWDDIALNMVGYQTEKTDIDKAVRMRVYKARQAMQWARETFTRNQYKMSSQEALDDLYERTTEQYNESLKDLSLCIRNAELIGVPPVVVNEIVSGPRRGFSEDELNVARAMIVNPDARLFPTFKGYNK